MKLANLDGRATIVTGEGGVDLHDATEGRYGPDVQALYDDWESLVATVAGLGDLRGRAEQIDQAALRSPVPMPRQVFAIGLNYAEHARESGLPLPEVPATFTKYPSSLSGPFDPIEICGDMVDWEVELVAVVGRRADRVDVAEGWSHVAGLAVGQDVSDRDLQFAAGGQFSLGKSRRGYGPVGPWLVTADELADPDDLALGCAVDGVEVQRSRTSDLVFSVPELIAQLSAVCPLLPGDVVFTGTPAGVGLGRTPPTFLRPGQVLESWVEGIGAIRNLCT